jgi:hypothetical protein
MRLATTPREMGGGEDGEEKACGSMSREMGG